MQSLHNLVLLTCVSMAVSRIIVRRVSFLLAAAFLPTLRTVRSEIYHALLINHQCCPRYSPIS